MTLSWKDITLNAVASNWIRSYEWRSWERLLNWIVNTLCLKKFRKKCDIYFEHSGSSFRWRRIDRTHDKRLQRNIESFDKFRGIIACSIQWNFYNLWYVFDDIKMQQKISQPACLIWSLDENGYPPGYLLNGTGLGLRVDLERRLGRLRLKPIYHILKTATLSLRSTTF